MKLKILFLLILFCTTQFMFLNLTTGELDNPSLKLNYNSHIPILIDGDLQLNQTVQNEGLSGSGTESDPYIIEDLFISDTVLVDSTYEVSLTLKNIHQHLVVKDNLLRSSTKFMGMGLYLHGCSNITLLNNDIEFYSTALYVLDSDDIIINGNNFFDNTVGTFSTGSGTLRFENNEFLNSSQNAFYIRQADNVVFQSNTIKFSATNLMIGTINLLEEIASLVLFNNTFEHNNYYGVVISLTSDAQIKSNSFRNNGYWDMNVLSVTSSNITRNHFIKTNPTIYQGNIYLGTDSNTNIIYENNFHAVSPNAEHIFTDTTGNLFSNNGRGNYYSKYAGVDANNDSIGDTPYTIASDVFDDYPLMKPVDLVKPILSSHDTDLTYEEDEDVSISWEATDANPTDYDAYDNDSLIKSDSWINGSNEVNLGNLSVGIHIVTINLYDIDDNSVSFNIRVNVTTSGSNATDPLGDLGALISDNILPIAAVTGLGAVSVFGARRVFGGKKKPQRKKK